MLPVQVKSAIEEELNGAIARVQYIGGGSINRTVKIEVDAVPYFVKWNDAAAFPDMFSLEVKGLNLLRGYSEFVVPDPVAGGETDEHAFLIMQFLERGKPHWSDAGKVLARMHSYAGRKDERFGLSEDNYIGSLKQSNRFHNTWAEFFSTERILPQMKLALDQQRLSRSDLAAAENFCKRIGEIFPDEKPSLLHGDLWSGNFMFTPNGPAVFDPAVYRGHREMDIAMTRLFGGFDEIFYNAYNEEYPLEKNWKSRIDYCTLYPLLVHVNLFGGGYISDVQRILNHFT